MPAAVSRRSVSPLAALVFGAVCISFAPVFVKLIGETRLGPTAMGFWRTFFGAVVLFVISVARGGRPVLDKRLVKFSVLAGFIFFLDLFVWHRSVIYCGAGMATVLGNTQVFATGLLSWLYFSDRLTARYFLAAAAGLIGVVLLVGVFSQDVAFTPRYLNGVVLGLTTGLIYAHYLITLKWTGNRAGIPDVVTFMAWTSAFAALFLGIAVLIESSPLLPPDTESWLYLATLGLVAQALGWWAITASLAKIATARAGLILLLQPTLAMVWGVMMFAEQFTPMQLLGAVIALAAIYYGGLRQGSVAGVD